LVFRGSGLVTYWTVWFFLDTEWFVRSINFWHKSMCSRWCVQLQICSFLILW